MLALMGRSFGFKEQVFAEVVADAMREPVILPTENQASSQMARDLARALVGLSAPGTAVLDRFRIICKSAASEVVARIARDQIVAVRQATIEGLITGEYVGQRAAILLSLLAGVQLMRQQIALPALADADPEVLTGLLEPRIALILRGK